MIPAISMQALAQDQPPDLDAALAGIARSQVRGEEGRLDLQVVPSSGNELLLVEVDVYRSLDVLGGPNPAPRFTLGCEGSCLTSGSVGRRLDLVVDGLAVGEVLIVSSLVVTDGGVVAIAWGMTFE
jgi:hypothetical protein